MDRSNIGFFHSVRNSPCFIQDWSIKSSGLQNMQMLNMSWPLTLLRSRFWINIAISSPVNVTVEIDLSVFFQILEGSLLELFIIQHCLAKKQLDNSAFFLKSVTYLFWWKRGGMQGILLLFNNDFNIDQQVFALLTGSMSFLEIRK